LTGTFEEEVGGIWELIVGLKEKIRAEAPLVWAMIVVGLKPYANPKSNGKDFSASSEAVR
jgi:hypothetical protein